MKGFARKRKNEMTATRHFVRETTRDLAGSM